ncbi:11549_t:CDS:2, partial [Funneliformis geosporum]
FTWPEIEENTGYICTCAPLEFGTLNKISPSQIDKISKSCTFEKPIHNYTIHTRPLKLWTIPLMSRKENIQEDQVILEVEEEQTGDMDIDPISKRNHGTTALKMQSHMNDKDYIQYVKKIR